MAQVKAYVCCSKCKKPVHTIRIPPHRTVEDLAEGYENRKLLRCPHQDCRAENVPHLVTTELPDSIHHS